jgi:hypothetical protein
MVFLSWRFAHPQEVMLDWTLMAMLLSVGYLYGRERKMSRSYIEHKELEKLR